MGGTWQAGVFARREEELDRRTNLTLQGATFYTPYYGLGRRDRPVEESTGIERVRDSPACHRVGRNLGGPGVVPGLDHVAVVPPNPHSTPSARYPSAGR